MPESLKTFTSALEKIITINKIKKKNTHTSPWRRELLSVIYWRVKAESNVQQGAGKSVLELQALEVKDG